jgi:T5SS/PEP-CTERM-associated repeat protein
VLVTGTGSSLTSSGTVTIGWTGAGSLSVTDGAIVSGNIVHIGRRSAGSATVVGSGSVLAANSGSGIVLASDTSVAGGNGILTLTNGGMARSNNGASSIRLSLNAGGTGTLNIGAPAAAAAAAPGIVNASAVTNTVGSGTVQLNSTATAANPFFLTKDGTATGANVIITGLSQVVHTAGYSVFGGVNTNSGATTVNGGTLIVTGSANNSAHTVKSGATLGGSGSVGSLAVEQGAFVSPGQSPGTLSVAGGATLAAGSNFVFGLADAAGAAGTDWDLLNVGGTLTLLGTSASPITVFLTSLDATFAPGLAANFNGQADAAFTIASAAAITGFDPSAFVVDTSAFANAFDGTWSVSLDQDQIVLSYAAGATDSAPVLGIAVDSLGDLAISCPSETGYEYQLEVSTNLSGWGDHGAPQDGDDSDLIFTVPGLANPGDKVFYRVRATRK